LTPARLRSAERDRNRRGRRAAFSGGAGAAPQPPRRESRRGRRAPAARARLHRRARAPTPSLICARAAPTPPLTRARAGRARSTKMAGDAPPAPELSPKMLVVPCLMMAVKFLKLDFAPYVEQLRIGFGCACALTLGVHFLVKSIAAGKADATEITVTTTNPMKPGEKETKTWTICNYDQAEALKKVKSGLVSVCMVSAMHYKWGSPMPLLFQCIMQPMNLLDDPLVQIHLLGKKPEGKLERPFKAPPNPLADLLGGDKAADDDKAVARKPKAGNPKKKD
jgi:hypothetical protein